jgi:hypothetical protein
MTAQRGNAKLPYDPQRAIEHIQKLEHYTPQRIFAVLFPLWEVESTAQQEERRPYQIMELYIERGLAEAGLQTVQELSHFFGLQEVMIAKVLHFLERINHVSRQGENYKLEPLGYRSLQEGQKFNLQEKRLKFYFDAYTSHPLQKQHYDNRAHILSEEQAFQILHQKTYGYRYYQLSSLSTSWQTDALEALAKRRDRADFNVPAEIRWVQAINVGQAYLPMYIIKAKGNFSRHTHTQYARQQSAENYYIVYTGIQELRDLYFEKIVNNNQTILSALNNEREQEPEYIWQEWLKEKGITGTVPLPMANGTWQIKLPPTLFIGAKAKLQFTKIGDYELRSGYFIHIWCDDRNLRRKAALERILRLIKRRQQYIKVHAVHEHLQLLERQLETGTLTLIDLQRYADESNNQELKPVLQRLATEQQSEQQATRRYR